MAKAPAQTLSIQPLGDRVVVKPSPVGEISSSGIIIPDTAKKDMPSKGVVMAVGPGKYDDGDLIPVRVSVGDTVMFSKYGYDEVQIDGVDYYILSESSLLAIV